MTDRHYEAEAAHAPWPLRPVLLAAVGAVATWTLQRLLETGHHVYAPPPADRAALAVGVAAGAGAFGFTLERLRARWTTAFALLVAVVVGSIAWWDGGGERSAFDWRFACLLLAAGLVVPLFQTARDAGAARFDYRVVHGHAWTNVVLWFACWAFAGVAFALAWLLASLFDLIGIPLLSALLRQDWANAVLFGAAFGGSLGLLRERDGVLRLLQRVVTAVLGVLAPVLGAGLMLFLVALPFTGLHRLWEATRSTTPILLGCVIGALILANAVLGNGPEEEPRNPALRYGGVALGIAVLPLALIAALATALRIAQHGLTPDRLWAVVFTAFAVAYGLAYAVALARGRRDWGTYVRPANLRLAFAVAGVALVLATPLVAFNALSAADQERRLASGTVTPETFDWAALAFDFGKPGKDALARLARSRDVRIAARARKAAAAATRWELARIGTGEDAADALVRRLRVLPNPVPVPPALRQLLTEWSGCGAGPTDRCTLLYAPGADEAIALRASCFDPSATYPVCQPARYRRSGDTWALVNDDSRKSLSPAEQAGLAAGDAANHVEVRTVPARRVYVGGVPVGGVFE